MSQKYFNIIDTKLLMRYFAFLHSIQNVVYILDLQLGLATF
jgi:hypothetical protein